MDKKLLIKVAGIAASIFVLLYGIGLYQCYYEAWPIVKRLCVGPNGGNASFVSGSYWSAGKGRCTITFLQGESMISYNVNLDNETASLLRNDPLSRETKYEAIF